MSGWYWYTRLLASQWAKQAGTDDTDGSHKEQLISGYPENLKAPNFPKGNEELIAYQTYFVQFLQETQQKQVKDFTLKHTMYF